MIKRLKGIPNKIYICHSPFDKLEPFFYMGTDIENPACLSFNSHIFIRNNGKPTVEKIEIDAFEFQLHLDEQNYFSRKCDCSKYRIERTNKDLEMLESKIAELQSQKNKLEKQLSDNLKKH